jgi:hypothetical protein
MEATLSSLAASEQRQTRRRLVNFAAALGEEGASSAAVRVSDVSEGGCRLRCEQPLGEGSEMWLKLPGLEARRVRVVWTEGHTLGCEFETPLYPGEIETLAPPRKRVDPTAVFKRS